MKIVLLLAIFFAQRAFSQDISDWVRIDCGSDLSYKDVNGDTWNTDEDYIKTGQNQHVTDNSSSQVEQLNTLRVFTEQNKNCYTLPTPTSTRYLIRAMFLYGNYDGLSNPPTFDLQFDGNKWATVVTNMSGFTYYEMIYATKGDSISICLARTRDQQFPFISRLESLPLPFKMYAQMRRDVPWFTSYRYNYGANDTILGYPDDQYNRIWEPLIPSGLKVVTANFTSLNATSVNAPPDSAIILAVEAQSSTDTIELSFSSFGNGSNLHHVEMYFTEPFLQTSETRTFNITMNKAFVNAVSPEYQKCLGIGGNSLAVGTLNVQLAPTNASTLPPIISAIEVYTVSEPLVTATTSQNDLDGLGAFVDSFEQLKGWSGDPCLPNDAIWQWLNCGDYQPPRVTSINLTGYGLQGSLPDFSQMDALVIIDVHSNYLNGEIPDFLGKLPNLRLLDLRYNDFSGNVPETITDNKQIKLLIDGNKHLGPQKSQKANSLASVVVVVIVFGVIYYAWKRRRSSQQKPSQPSQPSQPVQLAPSPWSSSRERLTVTMDVEQTVVHHVRN